MDAYQQAVEYLTENPDRIHAAWSRAGTGANPGECLFLYASHDGKPKLNNCGCLTMIRGRQGFEACTPELTVAIRADRRIPSDQFAITVDLLPIFAGWQRRIDKILGRTPPPLDARLPAPKGDIEIPEIELQPA